MILSQLVYMKIFTSLQRLFVVVVADLVDYSACFFRSNSFQGRLLKHNLDAEVVNALKDLRQKLSEHELN